MNFEIKELDEKSFDQFFDVLNLMSEWEGKDQLGPDVKTRLKNDYFVDPKKYECLVAVDSGKVIGFIVFFETYATFDASATMYIEDLFLLEEYRGKGLGKSLLGECVKIAKKRNYSRVDFLAFGDGPRKFYEHFGAKSQDNNHHYRIFKDLIKKYE